MKNYRHIVLFKLHDGVAKEKIEDAINLLKKLGSENGDIIEWKVEQSLDGRKGIVIVESGLFTNKGSFQMFCNSNKHHEAGELMKQISDWFIGDYIE